MRASCSTSAITSTASSIRCGCATVARPVGDEVSGLLAALRMQQFLDERQALFRTGVGIELGLAGIGDEDPGGGHVGTPLKMLDLFQTTITATIQFVTKSILRRPVPEAGCRLEGDLTVMFLFSKEEDSPRLKQLRALSLFSTLGPRELKTVDGLLHERSFLKDEVIFDQGEEGQALYIIESGKVLICRQGQAKGGKIAEVGRGTSFRRTGAARQLAALGAGPCRGKLHPGGAVSRRLPRPAGDPCRDRLEDLPAVGAPHRPAPARDRHIPRVSQPE
jgi:hypothetical protein